MKPRLHSRRLHADMDRPMAVSVNRPLPEVTLPLLTLWLLPLMSTWAADKQIPTLISAAVGESSLQPRRTPLGQPAPTPGSANNLASGSESPAGEPYSSA